jgi:hypothetical protein
MAKAGEGIRELIEAQGNKGAISFLLGMLDGLLTTENISPEEALEAMMRIRVRSQINLDRGAALASQGLTLEQIARQIAKEEESTDAIPFNPLKYLKD